MDKSLYVQFGCGRCAPETWRNFDGSPTVRFERLPFIGRLYTKNHERFPENIEYGDIIKGLPIAPDSCSTVYCSHVLEHLALADCRVALRNTFTILKPGGTFRLVLPDLEIMARRYLADDSQSAALDFIKDTLMGSEVRNRGVKGLLYTWLGNSSHLWMWDYKSLAKELEDAGFTEIRRAEFGDSPDPMFAEVEEKSNWVEALGIECRKP